jgi:hypothetical protein
VPTAEEVKQSKGGKNKKSQTTASTDLPVPETKEDEKQEENSNINESA